MLRRKHTSDVMGSEGRWFPLVGWRRTRWEVAFSAVPQEGLGQSVFGKGNKYGKAQKGKPDLRTLQRARGGEETRGATSAVAQRLNFILCVMGSWRTVFLLRSLLIIFLFTRTMLGKILLAKKGVFIKQ